MKMLKTTLIQKLPIGSAGCGDIRLLSDGYNLLIQFEYACGGNDKIGAIKFENVTRYEFCEENACREFVPGSLHAVVEVDDLETLSNILTSKQSKQSKHYYVLYLSGSGRIDVVAKSVTPLPPSNTWHVID